MKSTITRYPLDGSFTLHIESESTDEATLIDVLLHDWRLRRQHVAMSGCSGLSPRDRRPYFGIAALPAASVPDLEISERVKKRDERIHALELEAVADSSAHEHDIATLRRDLETAHTVAKSDREKRDARIAELEAQRDDAIAKLDAAHMQLNRYAAMINSPSIDEFFSSVRVEAAHQIERWGVEHDAGKRPEDWITLFMYLLGKASKAHFDGNRDKLMHHIVTVAAVALNWHRNMTGDHTAMRPGVSPA